MSGAGAIMDMTTRFKQNRGMLNRRQEKRRDLRKQILSSTGSRRLDFYHDRIPAETLQAIKTDIRNRLAKQRKRNVLVTILSLALASVAVLLIYRYSAVLFLG